MRRIDLLCLKSEHFSQYGVLRHFEAQLLEALVSFGFDSKTIYCSAGDSSAMFKELRERQPDCTLSINGFPYFTNDILMCDALQIPQVAILMDAPYNFFRQRASQFSICTNMDRSSIPFYRGMGFEDMFFFPHAVDSQISYDPAAARPYDVAMLASCIDLEAVRRQWEAKFDRAIVKVMEEAIGICLSDRRIQSYQAFDSVLAQSEKADPQKIQLSDVLNEMEQYIRGKDRVELIRTIKSGQVHVIGSGEWKKYVGRCPNVVIHEGVPFEETLDIMKKSKIVLNSCPTIKDGVHERLLLALACGAVVVSSASEYINEQFGGTGAVGMYANPSDSSVDQIIADFLKDPKKRREAAEKGREIVMQKHTWEQRVKTLSEVLPALVEKRKGS